MGEECSVSAERITQSNEDINWPIWPQISAAVWLLFPNRTKRQRTLPTCVCLKSVRHVSIARTSRGSEKRRLGCPLPTLQPPRAASSQQPARSDFERYVIILNFFILNRDYAHLRATRDTQRATRNNRMENANANKSKHWVNLGTLLSVLLLLFVASHEHHLCQTRSTDCVTNDAVSAERARSQTESTPEHRKVCACELLAAGLPLWKTQANLSSLWPVG